MEMTIEHEIVSVTVYPDRARISCRGVCQLAVGSHQLLFDGLPLTLDQDSLRAGGRGTANTQLSGVDCSRKHFAQTPAVQVQELEAQIESLGDDLRVLEDAKEGWQAQAAHLAGLQQATTEYARGLAKGRTTVEDQARLTQFLHAQDGDVRAAVREIEGKQRVLNRDLQKLQKELAALRSVRPRQRFQARVEVEALSEGSFRPEISYVVTHAGWKPLYDLRLMTGANGRFLHIAMLAQVTQQTGQDWSQVDLVLSTARPALNQRLPELKPWYVNEFKPRPPVAPVRKQKSRQSRAMMAAPAAPMAGAPQAEMMVAAQVQTAVVEDSGTAVRFVVRGKSDIPSDGSPHKTTLNQFELPAKINYLTVPKRTDAVFRRVNVLYSESGPLLAGPVNLFMEDEFIGKTKLAYTPSGGEIEMLLGVEERITITRELVKRDVDKRFLRDDRQLRYGYKLELENLLPDRANVEVQDHFPVARHEKIRVKFEKSTPPPTEVTDLNVMTWEILLAPHDKKTIQYEYSVEHPRSMNIAGLI